MKSLLGEIAVLLALASVLAVTHAVVSPTTLIWQEPPGRHEVTVEGILDQGLATWFFIDTRAKQAFEEETLPGAFHLTFDNLEAQFPRFLDAWDLESPIVVFCDTQECGESQSLAEELRSRLGTEEVYSLYGGWAAWGREVP